MPWWWWVGALSLVGVVGVVKGKRTRRKVWRAVRRYAEKRRKAKAKARAKARTATRQSRPGRAPARSPWREAKPVEPPRVARKPVLRIQRCSASCRTSRKPAATCDCACGGRDHGRYRTGTAASIRATKYTPAQRTAQRRVTNTARTERWERREAQRIAKAKTPVRGGKAMISSGTNGVPVRTRDDTGARISDTTGLAMARHTVASPRCAGRVVKTSGGSPCCSGCGASL